MTKGLIYPDPPYEYKNIVLCSILYFIEREKVRDLVPEQLKVPKIPMVMSYVALYPESSIGPYNEAITMIQSSYKNPETGTKIQGFFCNSIYVDFDIAVIAGREIWGFPKKMASITLAEDGNDMVGRVVRNGKEIMKISVTPTTPEKEFPLTTVMTLKKVPKSNESGLAIQELNGIDFDMKPLGDLKKGDASITFKESKTEHLHVMEPKSVIQGTYGMFTMIVPYGRTIMKL